MNIKLKLPIITITVLAILTGYMIGCKKLDLMRIALVEGAFVSDLTSTSMNVSGTIIDAGENLKEYGVCYSTAPEPTIDGPKSAGGNTSKTGEFSVLITGLTPNTSYNIRSYIIDDGGVTYSDQKETIKTPAQSAAQWLHYDNGTNYNSIGFTSGGDFDVAIRFPSSELIDFQGFVITRIRFFPMEGTTTEYNVTIWQGSPVPDLYVVEQVANLNIGAWTEYTLQTPYPINTGIDLWVGYWVVNHPENTFPAGVDQGPAITGLGDLISSDDGESWEPLSEINPPDLDYNWNLQFYIQNMKGEEFLVSKGNLKPIKKSKVPDAENKSASQMKNANLKKAQQ